MKGLRRGSVLILTLIAGSMIAILVGAMGAYYVHTARIASDYVTERSVPRSVGQVVLEEMNQRILNNLDAQRDTSKSKDGTTTISVGTKKDGKSVAEVIEEVRNNINSQGNAYADGEYPVKIEATRIENTDKLRITATVYSQEDEVLVQLEEIMEFYSASIPMLTTIPIFDYVYFANNNGRLNSSYVIANGEIGANGDFAVNGATVNGYVQVQGAVSLNNNPKACPRKTYMKLVESEYSADFTPVRPTNKMIDSSGIETTWNGGYEPIKATNSYTKPGAAPASVDNPGPAPSEPTIAKPTEPDYPELEEPTEIKVPEAPKDESGAYPTRRTVTPPPAESTIKETSKTETTTVTVWKYRNKNYDTEAAAIAQQKKDGRNITTKQVKKGKSYVTKWVYNKTQNKGGTKATEYDTEAKAKEAQRTDGYAITTGTTTKTTTVKKFTYDGKTYDSKDAAEAACTAKWNNYRIEDAKAESEYQTALTNYNKKKEEYKTAYAAWEKKRDEIKAQNEAAKQQAQKDYEDAVANYNNVDLPEYITKSNEYAAAWSAYKTASEAYAVSNATYNAYLVSNATYQAEVNEYNKKVSSWQTSVDKGEYRQQIGTDTYTETPQLLIRDSDDFDFVEMPVEGNYVTDYKGLCTTEKGSLTCANRFVSGSSEKNISWSRSLDKIEVCQYAYSASKGRTNLPEGHIFGTNVLTQTAVTRTLSYVSVENGYNENTYPFAERKNDSLKNTGDDSMYSDAALKSAEKGSVILVGTAKYPITIKGPVWFDGDVVIRGFVSGQGSIYAGRNIHIIGDLTYISPPNWPNTKENVSSSLRDQVSESNSTKDLLLLVARGNIVIGDYPSTEWKNDCMNYLKMPAGYRSIDNGGYATCKDTDIGYSSDFACDYSAYEGAASDNNYKMSIGYKLVNQILYDNQSTLKKLSMLWPPAYAYNSLTYEPVIQATVGKRRFYECKLGDEIIAGLMQSSSTDSTTESWKWSSSVILRWLYRAFDVTKPTSTITSSDQDVSQASSAVQGDLDAGDITQIDAVLYANHGIFGRVGGSASHKFTLNGAILCRDEGLLPSFAARAEANGWTSPLPRAWLNWDMRIKSDSSEGLENVGAKKQTRWIAGGVTNTVTSWRQVK